MTNFETALQTLVGRQVRFSLLVVSTSSGQTQPYELQCVVQEVMSDSFVGERDGNTIYVPFNAIAFVSALDED